MSGAKRAGKPSVVIRKEEVVGGGHHGGAWKVAYADFVTAMMAFFLLMWLLNATTQEQREGLASYFAPPNPVATIPAGDGSGGAGRTPTADGVQASARGALASIRPASAPVVDAEEESEEDAPAQRGTPREHGPSLRSAAQRRETEVPEAQGQDEPAPGPMAPRSTAPRSTARGAGPSAGREARDAAPPSEAASRAELERREREAFEAAARQIRDAVRADPALADIARQLAIDATPEGLRIQILDGDQRPMFATGSAALNERARALLAKVAPALLRLPQAVSISGHTDAAPFHGGGRGNWDLSAERALATRRLLAEAGLPEARMRGVFGHADRDPLLPADPSAAANRRVAIVVLREARPPR